MRGDRSWVVKTSLLMRGVHKGRRSRRPFVISLRLREPWPSWACAWDILEVVQRCLLAAYGAAQQAQQAQKVKTLPKTSP